MDFGAYKYVPMVGVRPSEMEALEELSPHVKKDILPFVLLQPWTTAKEFPSTITKVVACTSGKPIIVDLTDEVFDGPRRPVHDVFDRLRDSSNGYLAWRTFVDENPQFTPTVQLANPLELIAQVQAFKAMGRGVVIRLHEQIFSAAPEIAHFFSKYENNDDVYFVLDFQKQDRFILNKALTATRLIESIREIIPDCYISVSASTFPTSFTGIVEQDIYERQFYNIVIDQVSDYNFIYCDRASVRAEKQNGGGGSPAPRIDNAYSTKWKFFREADEEDRDAAFQLAAVRATECPDWQDLGIWGTEMIKKTAAGADIAIYSSKKSTSARINIHMHVQSGAEQVQDIEWTDL